MVSKSTATAAVCKQAACDPQSTGAQGAPHGAGRGRVRDVNGSHGNESSTQLCEQGEPRLEWLPRRACVGWGDILQDAAPAAP